MDSTPVVAADRERTPTLLGNTWSHIRTSQFWMVAIALFLRVGWILVGRTYKFKPLDNNFSFGWEMGRIGEAIASGHGFSNPFGAATGPTAWEPPLYPYLTAGVFQVFGIYSKASAFVLLAINSVFSALTCIPIFLIARRMFSEKVAVGSAWTWALLPYVMYWCTRWVWETSLSALLLAVIFWLTLTIEDRDGLRPWLWFGLLWGIAALNSTVLLSFLPASGLWAWYHRAKRGKPSFAGVALASVIFIACIAPWTVRNYQVFGKFIFIRDDFGAELRLGNGRGADGTWMQYLHPTQDPYGMRQFTSMGELAYIEMRKRQALDYIKADYGRFEVLCLKRFFYYWNGPPKVSQIWWLAEFRNSLFLASSVLMFWGLGRALRRHVPGAWLMFWLILLYPAIYYVVFPMQRHRHLIEPEITILAVYLLTEASKRRPSGPVFKRGRQSRSATIQPPIKEASKMEAEVGAGASSFRHWRKVILIPALLAPLAGFLVSYVFPAKYTSQSLVLVEAPKIPDAVVQQVFTEDLTQHITTIQQRVLSPARLRPMVDQLGLAKGGQSVEDVVNTIQLNMQIQPVVTDLSPADPGDKRKAGPVPGFYVNFTAPTAREAQQICTDLTSMLLGEDLKSRQDVLQDVKIFLAKQVEDARQNLDELDQKLAAIKKREPGGHVPASFAIDYDNARKVYQDDLAKQSASRMATQAQQQQLGEQMALLDPATLPDSPAFPNRLLFAGGGLIAGLVFGISFALWLRYRPVTPGLTKSSILHPETGV